MHPFPLGREGEEASRDWKEVRGGRGLVACAMCKDVRRGQLLCVACDFGSGRPSASTIIMV